MEYKINVRISNKHVHLTKDVYDKLFDESMGVKKETNQIGEFASDKTVNLINGDKKIENVRVMGPCRLYNQIEISAYDARILDLNPPVRNSGDLDNTPIITLETSKGRVTTNGVIIAKRHVHMNEEIANEYGVKNNDLVGIKINGDKGAIMDASVKISENGYYEAHFDIDDANATLLKDNDEATLIIDK